MPVSVLTDVSVLSLYTRTRALKQCFSVASLLLGRRWWTRLCRLSSSLLCSRGGKSAKVGEGFPRTRQIELAEFLCQFDWLDDNALDFIVIANLFPINFINPIQYGLAMDTTNLPQRNQKVGNLSETDVLRIHSRSKYGEDQDGWQKILRTYPKFHVHTYNA